MKEQDIIPALHASNKEDAFEQICSFISRMHPNVSSATLKMTLLAREHLGSTGIGDGVAIPHGKLPGISELLICMARCPQGIEFNAIDGKEVRLMFVLVAPAGATGMHLKALARMARMIRNPNFRSALMSAQSQAELYNIIMNEDNRG